MLKTMTCIICPNGCELKAQVQDGAVVSVGGALCARGADYARQEILSPMRTIASSVLVSGGDAPLCAVRLNRPVPKDRIFDVMAEIRKARLTAPVQMGDVVIKDVLGLGSDVIATKHIGKA